MKVDDVLKLYPELAKVLREAGVQSRKDIIKIDIDRKSVSEKLPFQRLPSISTENVATFKVHLKTVVVTIKTMLDGNKFTKYDYSHTEID